MNRPFCYAVTVIGLCALMLWWNHSDQPKDTLNISGAFEYNSQEVTKDGFIFSRLQMTESLIGIDNNAQPYPLLATKWQVSDDGLTWKFDIREHVMFHDGSLMTVASVVDSLKHTVSKPGVIRQVPIKEIKAVGHSVVIQLTSRYRALPAVLAHYSTGIVSPSSFNEDGEITHLFATGPYQIEKLSPPHKADLKRFEQYWGTPAKIEKVSYLAGHRTESRAMLAQTGQVDLAYALDPISMDSLKASGQVQIHLEAMPRTVLIKLNNAHPFLHNVEVRKAISFALDRTGIAESVLHIPGSEAYQLFSPSLGAWHIPELDQGTRQLNKAKELMANQGWALNSDGILERDNQPFQLQMVTYANRPELIMIATAIQAQLKELGMKIDISVDNSSAIPSKHHDGTLEMALIARNFGIIADPLPLLLDDTASSKGSDWGPTNWSSPHFNQLLAKLSTATNNENYQKIATQVSQQLVDEMPMIPVTYYQQLVTVNNRVEHFSFDPFELNYHVAEMSFND